MSISDLNQRQLADKLGVSETSMGHYKAGRSAPPRRVQDGLMRLSGHKPDHYLAGPDVAHPTPSETSDARKRHPVEALP